VVGHLEDRGFFVLVDRHDHLGVGHARQVLDSTGDAHRDVQLRSHDLAGLANLHVVRYEAGVNRSAGSAYGVAQHISYLLQHLEVVAVLHATATGDHDAGRGQVRTVRLGQLFADEGRQTGVLDQVEGFHCSGAAFGCHRVETGRTYGDHLDAVAGLD